MKHVTHELLRVVERFAPNTTEAQDIAVVLLAAGYTVEILVTPQRDHDGFEWGTYIVKGERK